MNEPVRQPDSPASTAMVELSHDSIDSQAVLESVRHPHAGAVVLFLGTVRELTGNVQTTELVYEAYEAMALHELSELRSQAIERWGLVEACVVHRIGTLRPCDVAVAVAVSSGHRREAFEAGQWLMDTLKVQVPIWKKEVYSDGQSEWVHPGMTVVRADRSGSEDIASPSEHVRGEEQ